MIECLYSSCPTDQTVSVTTNHKTLRTFLYKRTLVIRDRLMEINPYLSTHKNISVKSCQNTKTISCKPPTSVLDTQTHTHTHPQTYTQKKYEYGVDLYTLNLGT